MTLSLDSIYQPFNDFFTEKFATAEGEPVQFRFARLPQTFYDTDFRIGMNPDAPPSAELALQVFSEAVDGIATLDADGRRVSIGTSFFSDLYFYEILNPSMVFIPPAVTDETQRQALLDAFIQVKADGKARWEKNRLASLEAGESNTQYRPSTPTPSMWWDKNAAVWTPKSFPIAGAAPSSNQPAKPNYELLRMKIEDAKFDSMLAARVAAAPAAAAPSTLSRSPALMARRISGDAEGEGPVSTDDRPVTEEHPGTSHKARIATLPFKQRMAFYYDVAEDAPTQTVASTEVTISFDFCVVNVERGWLHDAFLNNEAWCIPGQEKGELSANDGHGTSVYPVRFVAVKNLKIKAPWTPEDISNLERSYQFGPFNFSSQVVDGAICHDDIQIVGYMLKGCPDLPPNVCAP